MISKDDIKKLSTLSRITISEEEGEKLAKDLEGILSYVGQLSEVSLSKKDVTGSDVELKNVMREDKVFGDSMRAEVLKESPKSKGDYFVVKKIL